MLLPVNKWNARKHGGAKQRNLRKTHIGIDEKTLKIRAVKVVTSNACDAPMLPELPDQIPPGQNIGSVIVLGACGPCKCHEAIAASCAQATIPPRKNAPLQTHAPPGPMPHGEGWRSSDN